MHKHGQRANLVSPSKVRWLVIATGCVTALTGLVSFVLVLPILASVLILGAIAQPRFPRLGRGLMWVGAPLLTFYVLPFGIGMMFESANIMRSGYNFRSASFVLLWAASFFLVVWCDWVLVREARAAKAMRDRRTGKPNIVPGSV